MPFEIRLHPAERIIEVVYPELPTPDDVADYLTRMKDMIDAQKGPWLCLVDQRNVGVLPSSLVDQLAITNSYAVLHGMQRSARVVATALAVEQANAIGRNGAIKATVKAFSDRDEALRWLKTPA